MSLSGQEFCDAISGCRRALECLVVLHLFALEVMLANVNTTFFLLCWSNVAFRVGARDVSWCHVGLTRVEMQLGSSDFLTI